MLPRTVLIVAVAVVLFSAIPAQAQPPGSFPFQYMVKFVCGFLPFGDLRGEPVKPGNYATAINIHNWRGLELFGSKKVALHYRNGTPPDEIPPIVPRQDMILFPRRVLEIDCPDIWAMADLNTGTFVKGMVHIGLPERLPVAAVYTAQTTLVFAEPPAGGAGISVDVEYVEPFFEPIPLPAAAE